MITRLQASTDYSRMLAALDAGQGGVAVEQVGRSSARFVAAACYQSRQVPLLYVTAHVDDAEEAQDDLELFADVQVDALPAWESQPTSVDPGDEIAATRVQVCYRLLQWHEQTAQTSRRHPPLVVASLQSLMTSVPDPDALRADTMIIREGQTLDTEDLVTWLSQRGFDRVDRIEQPGEVAVRGGIVDIFPGGYDEPVRIELFGDEVESVRRFGVDTNRSTQQLGTVQIAGLRQIDLTDTSRTCSFLRYLGDNATIAWYEPLEIQELGHVLMERTSNTVGMYSAEGLFRQANNARQMFLGRYGSDVASTRVRFDFDSPPNFSNKPTEAVRELVELAADHEVIVYCDNAGQKQRLEELLTEQPGGSASQPDLRVGLLHRGFVWGTQRLAVLSDHELFHRYDRRRKMRRAATARPIESFVDLETGDYVVHVEHGIAKFEGVKKLTRKDAPEEFLRLRFADNAILHVPTSQIDQVQKYIGFRGHPPLSKLGGTAWGKQKQKVREAVSDLALELLELQAAREAQDGVAFPIDTPWQKEFESSFVYQETEDQQTINEEIKRDMARRRPMDRLLCGDVGYGKTELAMRAAFRAVEHGYQVAVLVPTTILAEQHERSFRQRIREYPFIIESLSRFKKTSEQNDIIKRARRGKVDILIGTHRLLSDDVAFQNLGLLVIDEEQRFGVEHKEKLKKFRATVDVLTLTATPIPRTLHMSMLGIRDISSLATPPLDRRSIATRVMHFDKDTVRQGIVRELNRDGQVYFVHNRVNSIDRVANMVRELVPEARVIVGHGQMGDTELEQVMLGFVRGSADVLVCTTIIESGLDIPTCNTIFIHDADLYGLADLHQLRGRVGRYRHRAYAYIMLPEDRPITTKAAKRLKAIEDYAELGAGFRIAMRDLEIRGAGNILGPQQSGHIATVGYQMYCQLLEEAVQKLKNDAAPVGSTRVHVDLGFTGSIPQVYISADRLRMDVYRRIVACNSTKALQGVQEDLVDAYGPLPGPVQMMIDIAELRIMAGRWRLSAIRVEKPDVIFTITDLNLVDALFREAPGTARLVDEQTVYMRLGENYFEPPTLLAVLRKLLSKSLPAASGKAAS